MADLDPSARTLVEGGRVLALDGTTGDAEAMVVDEGRVVGVGSRDAMRSLAGAGGARVMKWDDVGALAPGFHADFVVVDRDPSRCSVDELAKTRVLATVVGGRIVHDDGSL